jgi:AcrR family transcriptional regulator
MRAMLRRMGNRERLLEGAKRSLLEKGYARTTARDIVAASGANLASIGYHFGSKDALLTAAMIEAIGEWGDAIEAILRDAHHDDPVEQLEAIWAGAISSITTQRQLWVASVEVFVRAERDPAIRAQLGDALEQAREGLGAMILGGREHADPTDARRLGALCLAVLDGLVLQELIDPERAPSAADLAAAIRSLGAAHYGDRRA